MPEALGRTENAYFKEVQLQSLMEGPLHMPSDDEDLASLFSDLVEGYAGGQCQYAPINQTDSARGNPLVGSQPLPLPQAFDPFHLQGPYYV